ncbi:MAG: MFS transporter [Geminicoccaceae bacterium]
MNGMEQTASRLAMPPTLSAERWRLVAIGLISFFTLVDLFATQAILPSLAKSYGVTPAAMGFAVNASMIGMAVAGLVVAAISRHLDHRLGVTASLVMLAVPTVLLAFAPNLTVFTLLRVAQGLCMSAAFTLTMAYLAESSSPAGTASALAAYVTGNVLSNLVGRLVSAAVADHFGLAPNFIFFAALNLVGACLAYATLSRCERCMAPMMMMPPGFLTVWRDHLSHPGLRAAFGVGFLLLFAFIGTFTYVNFVLVGQPIGLDPMQLGFVYLVFLPAAVTTPLAGSLVARLGGRRALFVSLAIAGIGLPLLLPPSLPAVLLGLALVGVGTFLAQAAATGLVGRLAIRERAAASGLYLGSYYLGGLVGTALLGQVFDRLGWTAVVAVIAGVLAIAAALVRRL